MAHARQPYSTSDHKIIAAASAFLAENEALHELCARYDVFPEHLAAAVLGRLEEAKRQALRRRPASMVGVMALARMAQVNGLFEADPLTIATIDGLLRLYPSSSAPARAASRLVFGPATHG